MTKTSLFAALAVVATATGAAFQAYVAVIGPDRATTIDYILACCLPVTLATVAGLMWRVWNYRD